jgi:hypothetical protein
MERRGFFSDPAKWLLPLIGLTVLGWFLVEQNAKSRTSQVLAAHQQVLKQHEKEWARREVDQQLAAHDARLARQRRHREEWLAAMGGPPGVALKDPDLTLTGMIEELARQCAPLGSRAHARADRFSEFKVLIELPIPAERTNLAEVARLLLSYTAEYVHRLQFSHAGALLGEIDRRGIESISDWTNAPNSEVEKLILDPEHSEPPTFLGAVEPKPQTSISEPQNLPEEFRQQNQAEQQFQELYKRANQQLRSAIELQADAVNLAGVRAVRDFDERRAALERADSLATSARAVLANPVVAYERILGERNLDPIYIRAATRTAAQSYERSSGTVLKIFDVLAQRSRSASAFLDIMRRNFGSWVFHAIEQQWEFSDGRARQDYERTIHKFDDDSRALQSAIEAWAGR